MLIAYHQDDLDGIASAAILSPEYPCARFVGLGYDGDDDVIDIVREGETVFFLDYSLEPWSRMKSVADKAKNVVVIDHHTTTKRNMDTADEIEYVVSMEKAACQLTWGWAHPDEPMPTALRWLGEYDLWNTGHEQWDSVLLPFQYGMRASVEGYGDPLWAALMSPYSSKDRLCRLLEEGAAIRKYLCRRNYRVLDRMAHEVDIDGHTTLAVNGTCDTNMSFFDDAAEYNIYLSYHWTGSAWSVTMWSEKMDVSKIAERHGGGGHPGAAGFSCNKLPWE